jgi:hypothetical protein
MGREYEEEKLFSDNIDRLLAGEDVLAGADMDNDSRTALDFARKMTLLRPAPSPQFQSHLKARMLQKLSEQEPQSKQGWFWKLFPREPVWQVVTVLVIMFVVGTVLWSTIFRTPQPVIVNAPSVTPPAMTSAPASMLPATTAPASASPVYSPGNLLTAEANTDKPVYAQGEKVTISVSLRNVTSEPFTVYQFPPILSLMQSSGQPVYTFGAGKTSRTLAPGETVKYDEIWDQHDSKGRSVSAGSYYLELENIDYQGRALQLNLTQTVRFDIVPASSGINGAGRILNINQSQSVNGLTINVQKVELDNGISVTAFISPPPDYVLLPGTPVLSSTKNFKASAGYSIDGSWIRDIGLSSVEYFAEAMIHTWYIPEPVSQSAAEMTFIVNAVGSVTGPWWFNVSLK